MNTHDHRAFFQSSLSLAEMEDLLRRIDENIGLHAALREQSSESAATEAAPVLNSLQDMPWRLEQLRQLGELLFITTGRFAPDVARRLLNIPLKVFARKQIRYNREMYGVTQALIEQIEGLHQHAIYAQHRLEQLTEQVAATQKTAIAVSEHTTQLSEHTTQLSEHTTQLTGHTTQLSEHTTWLEQMAQTVSGHTSWLEQIVRQNEQATQQFGEMVQAQANWLEQLAKDDQGQREWLARLAALIEGQAQWTDLLRRKMDMLALDVREHGNASMAQGGALPEAQIVDSEAYARRIETMHGDMRVNLGCGEKPLPNYINVDVRAVPEVDIIADIRRLPFEPGTLAEIASAHVVEHFREHQMRRTILPYWHSLLAPNGVVRIICPNWSAMLDRLNDGRMSQAEFKLLTFGAQDYEGDDHFAMYTPDSLGALLREAGFAHVAVVASERINGICPEMEIVASISGQPNTISPSQGHAGFGNE